MSKHRSNNSYSHILKYTGVFGGIQLLNILIALVRNKLVALILGPRGMGLVSLFNSTINLVSNSTSLGISMSAVKNTSEAYERGDNAEVEHTIKIIRSWSLLTAIAGMVICVAISPLLNKFTFSWGDHTLHFICLSPVISLMAITGGETAILKGTRRLSNLAAISVYNIITALVISVPIYYVFGEKGIVPVLILMATAQMILTIAYSYKYYPPKFSFNKPLMNQGLGMVKLGVAFVLAGVMGSGADFVIRSYLNYVSSLDTVGLYNAGYMMTMVYAGMVFSAMETDFFPRLSAVNNDETARNTVVNRQIEVSLMLVAPMLSAFMVGLPIILPLLYSKEFLPIMGMVQITILAMYVRAVKLPMAYMTLARGDSKAYLLLEGVYDIIIVAFTITGFLNYGLEGAGMAITIAGIIDFFVIYAVTRYKYRFRMSPTVMKYFMIQFLLGISVFIVTRLQTGAVYWVVGTIITVISAAASVYFLHDKMSLKDKFSSLFKHSEDE